MGYISLSWYDIPELVVPIRISLIDRELLLTRKRLNQGFLLVKFKSSLRKLWLDWTLWNIFVTNDHSNVPLFVNTSRSFSQSLVIIGFVTRLTRPVHLSSLPVVSGVRITRSLVLCVYFEDRCLSFCTFSIGYCVVCSSLINEFWLPLWYLQIFLSSISAISWPERLYRTGLYIWRAWRYQRGNHNPYIEEAQTTQWPK